MFMCFIDISKGFDIVNRSYIQKTTQIKFMKKKIKLKSNLKKRTENYVRTKSKVFQKLELLLA